MNVEPLTSSIGLDLANAIASFVKSPVAMKIPHRQCVFILPRILRPFFARRRNLLGKLRRIDERLLTQAYKGANSRPGLILFVQATVRR